MVACTAVTPPALSSSSSARSQFEYWQPSTTESKALAKALQRAGFRFVGPTTVHSAMEACGIVNGHHLDCWVRDAVERERTALVSKL